MTEADLYRIATQLLAGLAEAHLDLVPSMARIAEALRPCVHGEDFAAVRWYGARYSFTPSQAAIVRQLWAAWESGVLDVRQEHLLERGGVETRRLTKLFEGSPAWGTMIVAGAVRGRTFRLAAPAHVPVAGFPR